MLFVIRSRHNDIKSNPMLSPALICLAVLTTSLIVGCDQSDIHHYRVPKEKTVPVQDNQPPAADAAPNTQTVVEPRLVMPATWKAETPGQMQVARYSMAADGQAAEATVTTFPGDVGGLFANINRWRNQIGLESISQDQIGQGAQPLELNGTKATVVDMVNPQSHKRLIAAIVPRDGQTWFFKLVGDESLVAREKEPLVLMVKNAW